MKTAIKHESGLIIIVGDKTPEVVSKEAKGANASISAASVGKLMRGEATQLLGYTLINVDDDGNEIVEETTMDDQNTTEGAAAEGTAPETAAEGEGTGGGSPAEYVDPLLAQVAAGTDPTLAAVESSLGAATVTRRVVSAGGQSGQRLKRIERVTQLMAQHSELQPLFDVFTQMGMNVPEKLRNIRPSGNTVWFDAVGKGDELMLVKKGSGWEMRHKNVAGGKVNTITTYDVPSTEAIATSEQTRQWLFG